MLYYFGGLNEYSTADHYPISLSTIIPSLLGAFGPKPLNNMKKHSFVLRPSINALETLPGGGGEVRPYNSYKGMRRPTGTYFWDSDLKRSIII